MSASTVWLFVMTTLIIVGVSYGVISNGRFLRRVRAGRLYDIEAERRATQVNRRITEAFMYATFFAAAMSLWTS